MVSIVKTREGLDAAIDTLSPASTLAYDIETTGLNPHQDSVLIIAIGSPENTYAIDCVPLVLMWCMLH
jgi:ribonuclease D